MPMDVGGQHFLEAGIPPSIDDGSADPERVHEFKAAMLGKLNLSAGKGVGEATDRDWFVATALALRDRVVGRWLAGGPASRARPGRRVYYLSLEFLIGRLLGDVVENLRLGEIVRAALAELGVDFEQMCAAEPDAALGNGGLGRLAACFMDSMAALRIDACGYGIRYDHGLFRQVIKDGWQQEYPETWLSFGNPWEFERPELRYDVHYGGHVEQGASRCCWYPEETVQAVAYDTPIVGWRGRHVNLLRLWSARAVDPLRLDVFNNGDHVGALSAQARAEAISKVLYPSDDTPAGRELRLRQEYFFASASVQDLLRRHIQVCGDLGRLPDRAAIQLNDTHPAIAIAELMRLLIDVHGMPWDEAWEITGSAFSYTNHSLLPEALEKWPVELFARVLPRHLEIIYAINDRHLNMARRRQAEGGALAELSPAALSLIDETEGGRVRMGYLAFLGSRRVNGVSVLHAELMRQTVFGDFHRLYPERIVALTNGISFRRWLHQANPRLTDLVVEVCGKAVLDDPAALQRLAEHAGAGPLQRDLSAVKRANKAEFARIARERLGLRLDPSALFDVHIKRIHEYKRQLLNLLATIADYLAIRDDPAAAGGVPRVKLFAGKAAPSYSQAKLIVKLANDVADLVNHDPLVGDRLKLLFLPNYNVSLAQIMIPAADLSEQISTAGTEASGTGNMKLALNGALTIGTLDGANIEIRDRVGAEHMFLFGMGAEEVAARARGELDAGEIIAATPELQRVLEAIEGGMFSPGDPDRFAPLTRRVRRGDPYMVAADFAAYRAAQRRVDALWRDPANWARATVVNIAHMGWFSSDRTIAGYAREVWEIPI